MTDDTDDLDEFARMFGAKPETPPEGLLPPAEAKPTAPPQDAAAAPAAPGSADDPLAWLLDSRSAAATTAFPAAEAPAPASPAAQPSTAFPAAEAPASAYSPAQPTQVLPTRRSAAAEAAAAAPDTGRRNLIILGSIGIVILILIIVLVFVLIAKSGSNTPTAATSTSASTTASDTPSSTPSASPSATPSETPSATPTPTPTTTHAPPPAAPTLSGVVAVPASPVCGSDPTVTFSISYSSSHATSISIVSSGADGYSASSAAPSGTFTNVVYTCGSAAPEPTETYTVTATGPGGSASFALQVMGSTG